ncbi:GNAT family N-acetyltransferase [Jatrophihabitans sp. YIM 134969]
MTAVRIELADTRDAPRIGEFGARVLPPHHTPLIGTDAAAEQVERWWTPAQTTAAIEAHRVVVARENDRIVGIAQWGEFEGAWVVWKLYVDPSHRGAGLGPRLVAAVVERLPPGTPEVRLEHAAGNERAASFSEREGFHVTRVDPHPSGDPRRATVWRARRLAVPDPAQLHRVLDRTRYLVLGTADEDGRPWVSPVFFAALEDHQVCWVSGPDRRHSRNIAVRPATALTIFDSTVPVGLAEAVYADAESRPAVPHEMASALAALNARLPAAKQLSAADLAPDGPLVVYVAVVTRWYVLVRGGDPTFGNQLDMTVEV